MTLLNNDREKRSSQFAEWTDTFSRRSVIVPALMVIALLAGVWLVSSFLVGVTRIEAGYVGIEVNLAGSQRGASEIPVRTMQFASCAITMASITTLRRGCRERMVRFRAGHSAIRDISILSSFPH